MGKGFKTYPTAKRMKTAGVGVGLLVSKLLCLTVVGSTGSSQFLRSSQSIARTLGSEQFIKLVRYDCSQNISYFESTVFIDLGYDVSHLKKDSIEILEQGFKDGYNEANFALCDDPYFRVLSNVEIDPLTKYYKNIRGRDYVTQGFKDADPRSILEVDIEAQCRACIDHTIFSGRGTPNHTSTNFDQLQSLSDVYRNASLQKSGDDDLGQICVCPAGVTPQGRTPSETEFKQILIGYVQALGSDVLPASFDLYEIEEYDCGKKEANLTTDVLIQVDGNLTSLSDDEVVALEEAFAISYNELNFQFCDIDRFRTIRKVTLDRSGVNLAAYGMLEANQVIDPYNSSSNILRFMVEAGCYNCSSNTPIFTFDTQANNSPALPISEMLSGRSNVWQGTEGTCFCSAHPQPLFRAPTKDEFRDAFAITLSSVKGSHFLEEIKTVGDILEVSEVECNQTTTDFTSAAFVQLTQTLESLTQNEKSVIEQSFLESYNTLSFATCDQYFRKLQQVQLVPITTRRRRQLTSQRYLQMGNESNATEAPAVRFPAVFSVLGTCRNCPVTASGTFELFNDVFNQKVFNRMLFDVSSSAPRADITVTATSNRRFLQDSRLEVCGCPADLSPNGAASPTNQAFLSLFNDRLAALEAQGIITNFGLVQDIVEAAKLCKENLKREEALYFIEFTGNVDSVEDKTLSETFRLSYNSQRQNNCDPLVADVSVFERGTGILNQRPVHVATSKQGALGGVTFLVDSLQTDRGDLFANTEVFKRFITIFHAILDTKGYNVSATTSTYFPPTEAPSNVPTMSPSDAPSAEPSSFPSKSPTEFPTASPSTLPTISLAPSPFPTQEQVVCSNTYVTLTDSIMIEYAISRFADININLPWNLPEVWPFTDPATLIAAEEFLHAFNKLQGAVFCDPFKRKMQHVTCVSTQNNILSGTLCCTVQFDCYGNCKDFIFPDRDPIGAFYDQAGFEYPTTDSCTCSRNGPFRSPSAREHFQEINDLVPFELLSFSFQGVSVSKCPSN